MKVLACDVPKIEIGIDDVRRNFRILTTDKPKSDAKYYRELIAGENKNDDCMTWQRFKIEDIPLCISWEYFSDELRWHLDGTDALINVGGR